MKQYITIIGVLTAIGLCSCNDFLDRAPDLNLDEDKVFGDYETAYKYHADIYSGLRKGFNVLGSFQPVPLACASDEAEASSGWHTSNDLNMGSYDGVDNVLDNNYTGIRKANIFLSKVPVIPFPDIETERYLTGEAYFLRAFYFHEIVKRYGGKPLLNDKVLAPNDNLNLPRNSYRECVDAIVADLDCAADLLPLTVEEADLGRPTRGAALALKSRVLLYAASPVWDREITDADKWVRAAEAALEVINLKDGASPVYGLYSTGAGADDYEQQFFVRPPENREVIFWFNDLPKGFSSDEISVWAPSGEGYMGKGAIWPTQNFVDLYEMSNGLPIDDPDSGYDEANPYENRDPRFYKTIIYNGSAWQGITAETYLGGRHRLKITNCRTGYFVRKYLPETVRSNSSVTAYHNWQYIRLAEIYLNYAEAINEAEGPAKAYDYVNAVRRRSGMPDLPAGLSQEEMRLRIQRERAVELSFEDHRWWDVRRWKLGEKYFNGPFYGMLITRGDDGTFEAVRTVFENRIYTSKMNLYPIPTGELNKNSSYVQNPGW